MKIFCRQKMLCRADHSLLLMKFYRFDGGAETMPGASFHLDEDHHATIQNDQIELSTIAAIIPLDELVALFLEILLGDAFALFSQNLLAVVKTHFAAGAGHWTWISATSRTG